MREETRDARSLVRGEDRIARENVVPVGPDGPARGLAVGRFSAVMTMAIF